MKRAINLGSGFDYKQSDKEITWINVDYADIKHDLTHDLQVLPYPFKDNSADIILMGSVLEHLPVPLQPKIIMECYRILKKGGILVIMVPHFSSVSAWDNIEHLKGYAVHTLDCFIKKPLDHSQRDYMQTERFESISVYIKFGKKYQVWNYLIEAFANKFPNAYECSFLKVFPAEGVHYRLVK